MGGSRLECCSYVFMGLGSGATATALAIASLSEALEADLLIGVILLAYAGLLAALALLVVPWGLREWCLATTSVPLAEEVQAPAADQDSDFPDTLRQVLGQRLYLSILLRTVIVAGTINGLVEIFSLEHYTLWDGYPNNTGVEGLGPGRQCTRIPLLDPTVLDWQTAGAPLQQHDPSTAPSRAARL